MIAQQAIEASKQATEWVDSKAELVRLSADDRTRLASALFHLVIEHQIAIVKLLDERLCGSAFALARPLFETYLRGCWLLHRASDEQIEQFKADRFYLRFNQLVDEVENYLDLRGGILTRIHKKFYRPMCSYCHGGFSQAVRRIGEGEIGPQFRDDERAEIATFTHAWGLAAAFEIFSIANLPDIAQEALDRVIAIQVM